MKQIKQFLKEWGLVGYVVVILAVFFLFNFIKTAIRQLKLAAEVRAQQITAGNTANAYGTNTQRLALLKGNAELLQKAMYAWHKLFGIIPYWTSRIDEDEEQVINLLNQCNNGGEAQYVSDEFVKLHPTGPIAYLSKQKLSLREAVNEYLTSSERARIKAVVLGGLR